MKRITILACLLAVVASTAFAQEKTVFQRLTETTKKSERFQLFMNMQGAFNYNFDKDVATNFNMRQMRIEAKGKINDVFSYRWRQRLNRGNVGNGNIDNLPTSIDIIGLGINLSDKLSMFVGKQCTVYGGVEFDLNPIEIYEYCDMLEYMSCFLTGVNLAYQVNPSHQLQFQILDSRNGSLEETYGANLEESKSPLVYTLNWNGNFNNKFKTRYSISHMSETKDNNLLFISLGHELITQKTDTYFDIMYSKEDIDRKGIMTSVAGTENSHNISDAEYLSFVLSTKYNIAPNWKIHLKGMYETAGLSKDVGVQKSGVYRTSYGYLAGLEYYPMNNSDMHFFMNYVGRSYTFDDKAGDMSLDNVNRISIGFVYQLPMF